MFCDRDMLLTPVRVPCQVPESLAGPVWVGGLCGEHKVPFGPWHAHRQSSTGECGVMICSWPPMVGSFLFSHAFLWHFQLQMESHGGVGSHSLA